ncbi:NEAT domain-containing protein [Paenibacillus sp. HB172176]|uniref:NEAT domain-containing protein n=1 Tax=Paenibacillus sp. HB172176 TaxID=2493690 RepID=UPI00143A4BB9|nr:NEAT domain-containing protein [Paenibacillus sp. HB172176]
MKWKALICCAIAVFWMGVSLGHDSAYAAKMPQDGEYSADYLILQAENDSVSMANDYWEKPASVIIDKGIATIRLTINHSKWVTAFKVPAGSGYRDTSIIVTNKQADTRLVEFKASIAEPIVSKIHVTVPDIDYDHDYTIRLVFDLDSFAAVKGSSGEGGEAGSPTAQSSPAPSVQPSPSLGASQATSSAPASTETEAPRPTPDAAASNAESQAPTAKSQALEAAPSSAPTDKPTSEEGEEPSSTAASPSAKTIDAASAGRSQAEASGTDERSANSAAPSTESSEPNNQAKTNTGASTSSTERGDAAVETAKQGSDAAAVQTIASGLDAGKPQSEDSSSRMNVWTPIIAALILIVGAFFIWKRRRENPSE